jgi:phage tail sheath protein FI
MAQMKFGSPGVTAREIDISGPVVQEPVGVPAGVIGTSLQGPAFVPITVGIVDDFYSKFGLSDGKKFGPLAVREWLRNAGAATFIRVLGVGNGLKRNADGSVTSAGFTVGEDQPRASDGALFGNEYANSGSNSVLGRTYFLCALMSESLGSTIFSDAGLQGAGGITPGITSSIPIVRGVLMAPSGVILTLSNSREGDNTPPPSTLIATTTTAHGAVEGAVVLLDGTVAKEEFVMLLNGHQGLDSLYPNVLTASFDYTSPNYFANVFNTDPLLCQKAGHYLYAHWDIHPTTAVVTGTGIVDNLSGAGASTAFKSGAEAAAFITTGSCARNVGTAYVPNYETFVDRFSHARSPWFISQKFGGNPVNLFRVHALDAGSGISTNYKLSIENLAPSSDDTYKYGTFDLIVRDWNDNDVNQVALEKWRGLSLDPSSDRYISKIIGDVHAFYDFDRTESAQKLVVEGNYENKSNLIRIEVDSGIENETVDPTALPVGFRGPYHIVTSGSLPMTSFVPVSGSTTQQLIVPTAYKRAVEPPVPFRENITQGSGVKVLVNPLLYWGTQFEHVTSLTTKNASTLKNESLESYAKYFPEFAVTNMGFAAGDNAGTAESAENGIIDSDKFCRNMFTLENLSVVTSSTTLADPQEWDQATYVRNGVISADETAKSRRFSVDDITQANRRFVKFTAFMQGGFDGTNLFNEDETNINDNAVVADMNDADRLYNNGPNVRAYLKAIEVMKNVVNVDIQLLAIPGIRHPIVTDAAIDAVEERFDAMYVMDIEQVDNDEENVTADSQFPAVQLTATKLTDRSLDTSFAAAYFPDVSITDPNTDTNLFVPPSVVVLGALALNDAVGYPWFAPAGFTRGALSTTLEARVQLSKNNMDVLYDANINPLIAFPGAPSSGTAPKGGVMVWGQKTLQAAASSLDRVNVRRLMIDIRRQVREIADTIMFEQNRETTLAKFSAAVTPRLQRVQALSGLERYKIMIDSSTTTQADVENNTIRGKIFVKPLKALEYASLDFVVGNSATSL